jgi:hypothetical protein
MCCNRSVVISYGMLSEFSGSPPSIRITEPATPISIMFDPDTFAASAYMPSLETAAAAPSIIDPSRRLAPAHATRRGAWNPGVLLAASLPVSDCAYRVAADRIPSPHGAEGWNRMAKPSTVPRM